nr:PREDICTED: testis-expressed sequence 12 protein isoform X1 [Rhinolophus sinicus]
MCLPLSSKSRQPGMQQVLKSDSLLFVNHAAPGAMETSAKEERGRRLEGGDFWHALDPPSNPQMPDSPQLSSLGKSDSSFSESSGLFYKDEALERDLNDMSKEINLMLSTYAKILRQVLIVYSLESSS